MLQGFVEYVSNYPHEFLFLCMMVVSVVGFAFWSVVTKLRIDLNYFESTSELYKGSYHRASDALAQYIDGDMGRFAAQSNKFSEYVQANREMRQAIAEVVKNSVDLAYLDILVDEEVPEDVKRGLVGHMGHRDMGLVAKLFEAHDRVESLKSREEQEQEQGQEQGEGIQHAGSSMAVEG